MNAVIDISIGIGADNKTGRFTRTGDGAILMDIALTANQSNKEVTLDFKAADLTAGVLVFLSDVACVVKTNSSGSPDDTFTVPAGGAVLVPALDADITSLFITNSNATDPGTCSIRGVKDVTP